MENTKWLNLQLFGGEGAGASGAGEGGGEATTGDNATAAAEQRLRELGVPEAKIRKSASKVASKMPAPVAKTTEEAPKEETKVESATTEEKPTTEDTKDTPPARMSWDEIMKDPEYNKEMQAVVQSRLRSAKGAEEALGKLAPALELLARKHGFEQIIFAESFEEALDICVKEAVSGDAVLLSPACASWGMFPNYEVRGKMFKEYVNKL